MEIEIRCVVSEIGAGFVFRFVGFDCLVVLVGCLKVIGLRIKSPPLLICAFAQCSHTHPADARASGILLKVSSEWMSST